VLVHPKLDPGGAGSAGLLGSIRKEVGVNTAHAPSSLFLRSRFAVQRAIYACDIQQSTHHSSLPRANVNLTDSLPTISQNVSCECYENTKTGKRENKNKRRNEAMFFFFWL